MTTRYAIAQYLTEAEKQAMCAADYFCGVGVLGVARRRTWQLQCPLGVAGLGEQPFARVPDAATVTARLAARRYLTPSSRQRRPIFRAVRTFIADWDAGRLTPAALPAALGLVVPVAAS